MGTPRETKPIALLPWGPIILILLALELVGWFTR